MGSTISSSSSEDDPYSTFYCFNAGFISSLNGYVYLLGENRTLGEVQLVGENVTLLCALD
jgi:hypothetical protein